MSERQTVALVTGAGHRLGRAFALALAERGAAVAVHYNSSARSAQETADLIRSRGGKAELFQGNLTDPACPQNLIDDVVARMGGLDVLISSAAVMERTPVGEVTVEQWDSMFALNLRAPFFLAQAAAAVMPAGSTLINISDLAAVE